MGSGSRWLLAVKILAAVSALAAAVVIVLERTGVGPVGAGTAATAGITAAALAFVATAAAAVREYRAPRRAATVEDLRYALRQLAFAVSESTMIDVRELGLAVYVVRLDWPTPWRRRLARVVRERSVRRPSASQIVWRPGKGVIGRCVATGADVAQDVGADWARWSDISPEKWERDAPDDVRAGLTHAEFVSLQDRYHVVVATPVLDDTGPRTRVVGCLALDGPEGTYDDLAADDVRAAMAALAPTIGALMR